MRFLSQSLGSFNDENELLLWLNSWDGGEEWQKINMVDGKCAIKMCEKWYSEKGKRCHQLNFISSRFGLRFFRDFVIESNFLNSKLGFGKKIRRVLIRIFIKSLNQKYWFDNFVFWAWLKPILCLSHLHHQELQENLWIVLCLTLHEP